ncbi:hypothetical protein TURU_037741 [Turdus rufiventris]|nr:hypothetical protein TURU_037741 [Turdus rufiventris]
MEMQRILCFARQFSMDLQQVLHESLMVHGLQLGAIDLKKSQVRGNREEREKMNPSSHVLKIVPSNAQQELNKKILRVKKIPAVFWTERRRAEETSKELEKHDFGKFADDTKLRCAVVTTEGNDAIQRLGQAQ